MQLTGRLNYTKASNYLGGNFITNPELVLDYENAVPIMILGMTNGIFTNKKRADFNNKNGKIYSYFSTSSIINGDKNTIPPGATITNGAKIESHAIKYEQILEATSKLSKEFM